MDLEVPELTFADAELYPDTRVVRGDTNQPTPVRDALSLGLPVVQAITPDLVRDDPPLLQFLAEQESQWRFHLVHLACSFVPSEDTQFGQAWLTVRLKRGDDQAAPTPIAWSLTPKRSERSITQSRTVKLGAKLWLGEGNVEVQSSGNHGQIFLDTYGLQEPSCTWEFTRTASDEIRGTHRLALVTRAPSPAPVNGTIDLTATLQRKRFGLFTYRSKVDGPACLRFNVR